MTQLLIEGQLHVRVRGAAVLPPALPCLPSSLAVADQRLPWCMCPSQLGGRLLDRLTNQFLDYNLSVHTFLRGLRFCLLDFFSTQRLAGLALVSLDDDASASAASSAHRKRSRYGENGRGSGDGHDVVARAVTKQVRALTDGDLAWIAALPSVPKAVLGDDPASDAARAQVGQWLRYVLWLFLTASVLRCRGE